MRGRVRFYGKANEDEVLNTFNLQCHSLGTSVSFGNRTSCCTKRRFIGIQCSLFESHCHRHSVAYGYVEAHTNYIRLGRFLEYCVLGA